MKLLKFIYLFSLYWNWNRKRGAYITYAYRVSKLYVKCSDLDGTRMLLQELLLFVVQLAPNETFFFLFDLLFFWLLCHSCLNSLIWIFCKVFRVRNVCLELCVLLFLAYFRGLGEAKFRTNLCNHKTKISFSYLYLQGMKFKKRSILGQ